MFSDQQSGDTGSSDSGFGSPLPGGPGYTGKQPWFGPKQFGFGYGPRTWQGFLVTGLSVLAVIVTATLAKGTPWFYGVLIAAVAVHVVIIAVQRR